ncbi:MAG: MFS transporter [Muriicola sp.]|nr:MFS transporter [Muriicola sp.]
MPDSAQTHKSRFLTMLALVLSGEAIFFLPFILPRVFRPTMLDVFDITNFELGTMFSAYGIVAMASYFLGGPLADRFAARNLMSSALVLTSIGGLFMATIPSIPVMIFVYAVWGLSTILLFWAALIRATREWGTNDTQGRAYGILDAGRGLSAALISTVGLTLMSYLLPAEVQTANIEERTSSFQFVILLFSGFTLIIAILVWYALPSGTVKGEHNFKSDLSGVFRILKMPVIWLHAIIILCAYVGYKITDDFSLYAQDVMGYDEVNAAGVGTIALYLRPVAAIIAGFLADRFLSSRIIIFSFILLIVGSSALGSGLFESEGVLPFILMFLCVGSGVYALRVLYYAVMQEAGIPLALTGTAVGVISVVGYTPDIFLGPLMGWLLDSSPGAEGHQHLFLVMTIFAFVGLTASIWFRLLISRN